ncbi:Hypothetical predicted protein [Scomber scombrus]|uniref:Uncharacterized protein n=1 Tax=Scomber scombrus TaxID=13677 RepID=A0AAV1PHH1_SCOSC
MSTSQQPPDTNYTSSRTLADIDSQPERGRLGEEDRDCHDGWAYAFQAAGHHRFGAEQPPPLATISCFTLTPSCPHQPRDRSRHSVTKEEGKEGENAKRNRRKHTKAPSSCHEEDAEGRQGDVAAVSHLVKRRLSRSEGLVGETFVEWRSRRPFPPLVLFLVPDVSLSIHHVTGLSASSPAYTPHRPGSGGLKLEADAENLQQQQAEQLTLEEEYLRSTVESQIQQQAPVITLIG